VRFFWVALVSTACQIGFGFFRAEQQLLEAHGSYPALDKHSPQAKLWLSVATQDELVPFSQAGTKNLHPARCFKPQVLGLVNHRGNLKRCVKS
jgi:hypothetical protein